MIIIFIIVLFFYRLCSNHVDRLHKYVRDDVNANEEVEEPDHVDGAHQPIIDQ